MDQWYGLKPKVSIRTTRIAENEGELIAILLGNRPKLCSVDVLALLRSPIWLSFYHQQIVLNTPLVHDDVGESSPSNPVVLWISTDALAIVFAVDVPARESFFEINCNAMRDCSLVRFEREKIDITHQKLGSCVLKNCRYVDHLLPNVKDEPRRERARLVQDYNFDSASSFGIT